MSEFVGEICKYVMAGQSVMYVNTKEEGRVVAAIRKAGWLMAPDPADLLPAHYAEDDEDEASDVVDALTLGGQDHKAFYQTRAVDAALFIRAYEGLESLIPTDTKQAEKIERAAKLLRKVLDTVGYPTLTWDSESGFDHDGACSEDFRAAMKYVGDVGALPSRCLVVIKDAHMHLNTAESPAYRRALRNLYEPNLLVSNGLSRHLIFVQPFYRPHMDVAHCFAKLEFPLPNDAEIDQEISNAQQGIVDASKRHCAPELRAELIRSLRGLDTANIANTLGVCIVENGGFAPAMVRRVRAMRAKQLSAGQGLRIIDPDDPELLLQGNLGGYENVRDLADDVLLCRQPEAVALGLKAPTGFGVAGPPGTGKTHAGKLFANWLGLPLVVINMGTTKSSEGLYGVSEANMAQNLATVNALGECVVLFDEWDKQSSGIVGNSNDNTSSGLLSQVLEFASDPRRRAFLIFTMNRLHGPIESLRAGRISDFFYTPLPGPDDRAEIIKLKLEEQSATVPDSLSRIAADDMTEGLSGAELNELVNKACLLAFRRCGRKEPNLEDFQKARPKITPVTKLNKEEIAAMGDFKGVAVSVNKDKEKPRPAGVAGRRGIHVAGGN